MIGEIQLTRSSTNRNFFNVISTLATVFFVLSTLWTIFSGEEQQQRPTLPSKLDIIDRKIDNLYTVQPKDNSEDINFLKTEITRLETKINKLLQLL